MKPTRAKTGHIPGGFICPATGKKSWLSKGDAKAMAKRTPNGNDLSAYRCPTGQDHWHLGHLPASVIAGETSRAEIFEPKLSGRSRRAAARGSQTPGVHSQPPPDNWSTQH